MKKNELENIKKIYSNVWKEKCKKYPNESPISIIKKAPKRIIVIGDLHGDWNKTIECLKIAKVINNKNNWIGGQTVIVQLGDQIDRCRINQVQCTHKYATKDDEASDMKILYYFTKLHKQAQKVGGSVYSIMGNHELMNVDGDFRYVSRQNLLEFSDNENLNKGIKKRKELFKPGNDIANFLACTRKMALIIGSSLFVHAGIIPEIANKYDIQTMNQIIALYLFDKLPNKNNYADLLKYEKSPLWNRILGNLNKQPDIEQINKTCDKIFDKAIMTKLLGKKQNHQIKRTFIGHTPQLIQGINSTCNERIWYVDVGVSKAFDSFDHSFINHSKRSSSRVAQVIEIINDGQQINILKKN